MQIALSGETVTIAECPTCTRGKRVYRANGRMAGHVQPLGTIANGRRYAYEPSVGCPGSGNRTYWTVGGDFRSAARMKAIRTILSIA